MAFVTGQAMPQIIGRHAFHMRRPFEQGLRRAQGIERHAAAVIRSPADERTALQSHETDRTPGSDTNAHHFAVVRIQSRRQIQRKHRRVGRVDGLHGRLPFAGQGTIHADAQQSVHDHIRMRQFPGVERPLRPARSAKGLGRPQGVALEPVPPADEQHPATQSRLQCQTAQYIAIPRIIARTANHHDRMRSLLIRAQ